VNQTGTPCVPDLFFKLFELYEHDPFGKSVSVFPDHALSSAELGAN